MSEDSVDDVLAKLAWACERVNLAEERYRGVIDKLGIVDSERDSVLAEVEGVRNLVRTMCEVMIQRGALVEGHRKLVERLARGAVAARQMVRLRVLEDDKHEIVGPDIDCAARLHLCKARCCTMGVELAREDIADGIKWEMQKPYMLLHDADGWCHYIERGNGGCKVYDKRPATCRKYDCRNDGRVWIDFEARIPAPLKWPFNADAAPDFEAPVDEPME